MFEVELRLEFHRLALATAVIALLAHGRLQGVRVIPRRGPTRRGVCEVGGWTKTRPVSLGLLPSGPDPVGERYVLRQPPGRLFGLGTAGVQGRDRKIAGGAARAIAPASIFLERLLKEPWLVPPSAARSFLVSILQPPSSWALARRAGAIGLALLAASSLSGCGRRGPLEPPPDPTVVQKPATSDNDLGGPIKAPKVAPVAPPTQSLPIDKIL